MFNVNDALIDAFDRFKTYWLEWLGLIVISTIILTPVTLYLGSPAPFFSAPEFEMLKYVGVLRQYGPFFLYVLAQTAVFSLSLVFCVRVFLMGSDGFFSGGLVAFFGQAFRLFKRLLALAIVGGILLYPVGLLLGLVGLNHIYVYYYRFALMIALPTFGIAAAATCVDFPLSISEAWRLTRSCTVTLVGVLVLLVTIEGALGSLIEMGLRVLIKSAGDHVPPLIFGTLLGGAKAFSISFLLLTWGAITAVALEHLLAAEET